MNEIGSGFTQDDISLCVQKGLYGITLPMVKSLDDVKQLDEMLSVEEEKKGYLMGLYLLILY